MTGQDVAIPLNPGTTLGPYSVTAKIGEGGMGEVYRARDTKLDRDVALKVLPQAFTDDPDRLARFEREAKGLASLTACLQLSGRCGASRMQVSGTTLLTEGVQMRHRAIVVVSAVAVLVTLVSLGAAPAGAQTAAVRTAWDAPDLRGIWDFRTITPLERPAELADHAFLTEEEAAALEQEVVDRNARLLARAPERTTAADQVDTREDGTPGFYNNLWLDQGTTVVGTRRTSRIVDPPDGRLPSLTSEAERRSTSPEAQRVTQAGRGIVPPVSWEDLSPGSRCIHHGKAGPPINSGGYNNNIQLFQTPGHVAILNEQIHSVRVIPLDGRPHLGSGIRQWMGDSRGRWEDKTLVVETTNFNGKYAQVGRPTLTSSEHQSLIERFTRVDAETLLYEYTVTDPATWAESWTAQVTMNKSQDPLYEYACHEGNYSMQVRLAGARATEKKAAAGHTKHVVGVR